ncbi:MAG: hypothetical protein JWN04_1177 [Myxococcaceae bacterium]|nr:hypothetical protein [Myxococcaceae bacterium]
MIHPYDNKTQTLWDRGEFKVQLIKQNSTRPMGFCDGSAEDLAALRELAESEGAEGMEIQKQTLKSGREIWTLVGGE